MNPSNRKLLPRLLRAISLALLVLAVLGVLAVLCVRHRLTADLPRTAGRLEVPGLVAPAAIERDALGIPTLRGASRRDVAFATGFAHAQDRYFQMDLLRRRSAGELAELFGRPALPGDESIRIHLFRQHARRVLAASPPDVRELLEAYAAGANAGLASLDAPPFEYLVLRTDPAPWRAEDSVLVLFSMFIQLEDVNGATESALTLLHDRLPEGLFHFLSPAAATEWEAPIEGDPPAAAPIPGPEVLDLRKTPPAVHAAANPAGERRQQTMASNSWAVAGGQTASGGALLADELHLTLSVPNIWYRAVLTWPSHRLAGATLPGAPFLVVGSNGQVAWGLTNSVLDTSDLVLLDPDPAAPQDSNRYLTPQGPRPFERRSEIIKIKGEPDHRLAVDWTIWGPVVDTDKHGRRRAVRAVVDLDGAADFAILRLETAAGIEQALDVARSSGVPALNFVAADRAGRIGWTVTGRLPRRAGFDGETATSWSDGTHTWQGLLPPAAVPRVVDPPSGRLWTANNRVLAGAAAAPLGRGNFVLGARARQIRDSLLALPRATADDMRRLQLDDRALFLTRWHDLLLQVLTPRAVAADARRGELRRVVERWGARAMIDSAGYRMVRNFRSRVFQDVFTPLLAPCLAVDPDFDYEGTVNQSEGPLWQLVTARPPHLLDPQHKSWDEELLAAADAVIARYANRGPLAERTWGERNTVAIDHPLSDALPFLGHRLSMPPRPLPGDDDMPRVQERDFGASLRLVVSPGREEEGFFQMPGGESGNPVSEHYGDLYDGWARGAAAPLLPGRAVAVLELVPSQAFHSAATTRPSPPAPLPAPPAHPPGEGRQATKTTARKAFSAFLPSPGDGAGGAGRGAGGEGAFGGTAP
ncbi:MAG TPA: penicillin acylase family protein [Thermoanaerobaculia bacterium]|nr:penicillin acylase family protein [Thermoanaerobaculia bacterium]